MMFHNVSCVDLTIKQAFLKGKVKIVENMAYVTSVQREN